MGEELPSWEMKCSNEACELYDIAYQVYSEQAECGGCNAFYTKPE